MRLDKGLDRVGIRVRATPQQAAFAEEAFALVDRGDAIGVGLAALYVLVTMAATAIAVALGGRLARVRSTGGAV